MIRYGRKDATFHEFCCSTCFVAFVLFIAACCCCYCDGFEFKSGISKYDDAYNLAIAEVQQNIAQQKEQKDQQVFIAGEGWAQMWVRDTSYAIELGAGLLHPQIALNSLYSSTHMVQIPNSESSNNLVEVWQQDRCDHFGDWPNLSDAIVGTQGSWYLYKITGNVDFLKWAYQVTKHSLQRAEQDVLEGTLFEGCSSFMESNSGYPLKYKFKGDLVGQTKALSTNMLYYAGYKYGEWMGRELLQLQQVRAVSTMESEISMFQGKAANLRDAIRQRFWLPDKGYYAYFEDEDDLPVHHMEGLGEALVLLAPEFELDETRIDQIFASTYRTSKGIPCLWPRFEDIGESPNAIASYYHNGRIWPFVQGYWGLAASRHLKHHVFAEELENLATLGNQHGTFAEFYELDGSYPIERRRQLWSDAGYFSMIIHGLCGMDFQTNGIAFQPVKPESIFPQHITLKGVAYRSMILNITIVGSGTHVKSFELDGTVEKRPFVPSTLTGAHVITITVTNTTQNESSLAPSSHTPTIFPTELSTKQSPSSSPSPPTSSMQSNTPTSDIVSTECQETKLAYMDCLNSNKNKDEGCLRAETDHAETLLQIVHEQLKTSCLEVKSRLCQEDVVACEACNTLVEDLYKCILSLEENGVEECTLECDDDDNNSSSSSSPPYPIGIDFHFKETFIVSQMVVLSLAL